MARTKVSLLHGRRAEFHGRRLEEPWEFAQAPNSTLASLANLAKGPIPSRSFLGI